MKSENPSDQAIARFWHWFARAAPRLDTDAGQEDVVSELDAKVGELHEGLSWEIGPGLATEWQLVISPNLDEALWPVARRIVADAPALARWEFYSARQPKQWGYEVILEPPGDQPVHLNASNWRFVLLRYPDGGSEILLEAQELPPLSDDLRSTAAAIALESILGEEVLLSTGVTFDLVKDLPPDIARGARPIRDLPAAIGTTRNA